MLAVKMARGIAKGRMDYFKCKECGFAYKEKLWAEKCKKWCKEKHSCNIEITKHAVIANHFNNRNFVPNE